MEGVLSFFHKLGSRMIKHGGEGLMVVIVIMREKRIHGARVQGSEGDAFEANLFCPGKVNGRWYCTM